MGYPQKNDVLLLIDNVSKVYRGRHRPALTNIQFSVACGETVGFIGNNGAGKSTTIRLIMGLLSPSDGQISLNGLSPIEPESRIGVAYVPENPYLYDQLTPREILLTSIAMYRKRSRFGEKDVAMWLRRLGVEHVADKPIRSLSKGMTQRVALAHALVTDPDLLILDEPLSGLDPVGRVEVVEILDDFRKKGKTLFFSSHVLHDVERLADRFVFIHDGCIGAIGSPAELLVSESEDYEVVVEGNVPPEGFEPISSRLSRGVVSESLLPGLLSGLVKNDRKVKLHSVKNMNSLEKAYLKFVQKSM